MADGGPNSEATGPATPSPAPSTSPPPLKSSSSEDSSTRTPTKSAFTRNESLAKKALQQQQQQQKSQSTESSQSERRLESNRASELDAGFIYSQRAFKKSSQNGKLTLYLSSRDLIVTAEKINKLQGVLLIDPEILDQDKKVYGQVTLTFRYGREDEEVMGLKFCNEALISLAQLYPPHHSMDRHESTTAFQEVLVKRFYPNAHPFTIAVPAMAPPSVQLVPAKEYNGAPIGTSYDIRVYAAERPEEKLTRKTQIIKMGIRVIRGSNAPLRSLVYKKVFSTIAADSAQGTRTNANTTTATTTTTTTTTTTATTATTHSAATTNSGAVATVSPATPPSSKHQRKKSIVEIENEIKTDDEPPIPHAMVEKQFLLSDGRVRLEASLDRAVYDHGDVITVHVIVTNNSNKSVKRIEADIVQHVDVCMFSNGKFKNIVAQLSSRDGCPVEPGFNLTRTYTLRPEKGSTKNWIALEDNPGCSKSNANLASTFVCSGNTPEARNVFAIYVSYYVKVKIVVSPIGEWIGGMVSLKLPFVLMHNYESEIYGSPSPPHVASRILDKIETIDDPNEDPLPFIDKDNTSDEDQNDSDEQKNEESAIAMKNGDNFGLTAIIGSPAPTTRESTIAKLTTAPSVEVTATITTSATSATSKKRREDSPSNVDMIERYDDKERKGST